ncbi:serine/threonine-protein kinase mTOR-like [Scleropages formosus]|uniref:serine/threonine-protein kinase mTOR-like n=1 Tax=Scleropages formosus TaxID=113540 RepID=UPI0010FACD0E|nr:serine/threonine-protein kinase mTOR-like [Scleropages formosus]
MKCNERSFHSVCNCEGVSGVRTGAVDALLTSSNPLPASLARRCFLKLGEWQLSLQGINESTIPKVLQYYSHSTEHDRTWYKAWHALAVMNFEAVLHYKHQNQGRDEKKKLRHASGASGTSEASNSDSEAKSAEHSPLPSPGQKKVNEVGEVGVPGVSGVRVTLR